MSRTLIFIQNTVSGYHCHRRVQEAIANGWKVIVYGFQRHNEQVPNDWPYPVTSLGIVTDGHYLRRIQVYWHSIKQVLRRHSRPDTIFYLFGLDIAFFFLTLRKRYQRYVYEEADLVHTYLPHSIEKILEHIDKHVIKKAWKYVSTSEGFVQYHFKGTQPDNLILRPNQLTPQVYQIGTPTVRIPDMQHLHIGFMGSPRFASIHAFIQCYLAHFPQHDFHFYGQPDEQIIAYTQRYHNFHNHGVFRNPDDLLKVYGQVDMVLCTYDIHSANVRYAEPNKLYEAIYFFKPIIVTQGTFLADKVQRLGVGYALDPFNDNAITQWLSHLSNESIMECIHHCQALGADYSINDGTMLFTQL